ncbi:hypothetical protein HU200_043421 [Digitaria exilis]|uniref:Rx N-terminal domain-containing protein n=1 Tax=Digitaria exilis TaxID=1010633 RepID=A0A835EGA7_9POAL|nr:hypothetical protein HU200_043421 [Digitaria exilis]
METVAESLVANVRQVLGDEYRLLSGVGGEVTELRDDLATMNALLRMQSEADEGAVDHFIREWMKQLRELAYDVEDSVDIYKLRVKCCHGDGMAAWWFKMIHLGRTLTQRHRLAGDIHALHARAVAISERHARYGVNREALRCSATFAPAVLGQAALQLRAKSPYHNNQFVDIGGQAETFAKRLKEGTHDFKVFAVVGFGGVGKTTLAMEVCQRLTADFPYQAMPGRDLENLLKGIVQQAVGIDELGAYLSDKSLPPGLLASLAQELSPSGAAGSSPPELSGAIPSSRLELFTLPAVVAAMEDKAIDEGSIGGGWPRVAWGMPMEGRRGVALVEPGKLMYHGMSIVGGDVADALLVGTALTNVAACYHHLSRVLSGRKPSRTAMAQSGGGGDTERRKRGVEVPADLEGSHCQRGGEGHCRSGGGGETACGKVEECCQRGGEGRRRPGREAATSEVVRGAPARVELRRFGEEGAPPVWRDPPPARRGSRRRMSEEQPSTGDVVEAAGGRWIAEGLVSEKRGCTLTEVAETYLDELVSRNMVVRRFDEYLNFFNDFDRKMELYRVHDVLLEVMVSKSLESNFVSLLGEQYGGVLYDDRIRRLSIQESSSSLGIERGMEVKHVRSLSMFQLQEGHKLLENLDRFVLLRVLDLEGCWGVTDQHVLHACKLYLLRFLSFKSTQISKVPPQVKKLEHLQVLNLNDTCITDRGLSDNVTTLKKLERLLFILSSHPRAMNRKPSSPLRQRFLRPLLLLLPLLQICLPIAASSARNAGLLPAPSTHSCLQAGRRAPASTACSACPCGSRPDTRRDTELHFLDIGRPDLEDDPFTAPRATGAMLASIVGSALTLVRTAVVSRVLVWNRTRLRDVQPGLAVEVVEGAAPGRCATRATGMYMWAQLERHQLAEGVTGMAYRGIKIKNNDSIEGMT